MSDLTVVCGATEGIWERRAKRVLDSVVSQSWRLDSPLAQGWEIDLKLYLYKRRKQGAGRFQGLLNVKTDYVLMLDADVLATGDVRSIAHDLKDSGKAIAARQSPMQAENDARWNEREYRRLLIRHRLPYRKVVWNGCLLLETALAQKIVPHLRVWIFRYLRWRPYIFDPRHPSHDQVAWTLALAEAGILDEDTHWVGPETFSWQSHPGELGILHHFNGQIYGKFESKPGGIENAIKERRSEQARIQQENA